MQKKLMIIFFILVPLVTYCQIDLKRLIGDYYSVENRFEKSSILILLDNNKFNYKYELGGCQGMVTGKWTIRNNKLYLTNDSNFISKNSYRVDSLTKSDSLTIFNAKPFYPNLSLCDWNIGKDWIKPNDYIDNGCFKERGKHKKK